MINYIEGYFGIHLSIYIYIHTYTYEQTYDTMGNVHHLIYGIFYRDNVLDQIKCWYIIFRLTHYLPANELQYGQV